MSAPRYTVRLSLAALAAVSRSLSLCDGDTAARIEAHRAVLDACIEPDPTRCLALAPASCDLGASP